MSRVVVVSLRRAQLASVVLVAVLAACAFEPPRKVGVSSRNEGVAAVAEALSAPPEGLCTGSTYGGHDYWVCLTLRSWQRARDKCKAINYDLASVQSSGENAFLLSKVSSNAWIGGRDSAVEGAWRWVDGETQFWQGKANGSAVSGAYASWKSGEPDDLFASQDCAMFRGGLGAGKWSDEGCGSLFAYVCEGDNCPTDGNKTEPGQCGCGHPDTDGDGDGTADCVDGCPSDASKTAPGLCGCGVSDADADGDGAPACQDGCPSDATKLSPGDCGCANTPAPSGTACDDGLCMANTQCDGHGVCGSAAQCGAPDTQCTAGSRAGVGYWFCNLDQSYAQARQRCQDKGMDLAVVTTAVEDSYLGSKITEHSFLGGSDQTLEGSWRWVPTGTQFWSGGPSGSAVGGAYAHWESGEPSQLLSSLDCLVKDPVGSHACEAFSCTTPEAYVCEQIAFCVFDPLKLVPGTCGCGVADVDSDGDGTLDCNERCPNDPTKTDPGQCGCGVPDTDADADGAAECSDECPSDPNRTRLPCTPDTDCVFATFGEGNYFFCNAGRTYFEAKAKCENVGLTLAGVGSSVENAFIAARLSSDSWLGGNDLAPEGVWRWDFDGTQFWQGDEAGADVSGAYTNWNVGDPDNLLDEDCLAILGDGGWTSADCNGVRGYVCESVTMIGVAGPTLESVLPKNAIGDAIKSYVYAEFGTDSAPAVDAARTQLRALPAQEVLTALQNGLAGLPEDPNARYALVRVAIALGDPLNIAFFQALLRGPVLSADFDAHDPREASEATLLLAAVDGLMGHIKRGRADARGPFLEAVTHPADIVRKYVVFRAVMLNDAQLLSDVQARILPGEESVLGMRAATEADLTVEAPTPPAEDPIPAPALERIVVQ